jgi:hypothetical protein
MQAYAGAARRLLAPSAERALTLRSVRLRFLRSCWSRRTLLHTIGCTVEDMLVAEESSNMERLEFDIWTETEIGGGASSSTQQKAMFRRRLVSFLDACPVAFGWLTLQNLCFGPSDVPRLLRSCTRMHAAPLFEPLQVRLQLRRGGRRAAALVARGVGDPLLLLPEGGADPRPQAQTISL